MSSLAIELPNEINRVREIQDQFKQIAAMPDMGKVIVAPQIAMMESSIQRAISASSQGDVIEMLRAYEDLKTYSD